MNVRRWPNVSPTGPPKRIRPARVSRCAFATHCDASNPTPSSDFTFGSATLTTELSMNAQLPQSATTRCWRWTDGPLQLGRASGPAQRGQDLLWLLAYHEVGLDERADPAFCVDHVGRGNGPHPVR